MNQKIELRKMRDFGELVNDTFLFTKQNLKPLFKSVIYICGFFFIALVATSVLYAMSVQDLVKKGDVVSSPLQAYGWELALSMVFSIVFYSSFILTIFSYINLYLEKGNIAPEVDEVWAHVKFFFWKVLGALVLLIILNMIGFVFCILPGIYLWPITSIILAIIVFENSPFSLAFSRGFKLVKDNWWVTFGALFIVTLIVGAISLVIVLPATLLSAGSMLVSKTPMTTSMTMVSTVLQSLTMVFMVLPLITVALSYFSLAEAKDGAGLMDKVNMIGQNDADSNLPEEQY